MIYTKKHYKAIAMAVAAIRDYPDRLMICGMFITILKLDNSTFDGEKFQKACEV